MKKLGILLMMLVTISASAQKVTRKDLSKIVNGNTKVLLKDGFKYTGKVDGADIYTRYDSTEVMAVTDGKVRFYAKQEIHYYKKNVAMTPSGDLFFNVVFSNKLEVVKNPDPSIEKITSRYTMRKAVINSDIVKLDNGDNYSIFEVFRK